MWPVHVSRAALASNLVRQLKNLTFPIRRKWNLPPRIGMLQDTLEGRTSKRVLDPSPIPHELGHMSGMRSRPGTRAGLSSTGTRPAPSRPGSPGGPRDVDGVKQAAGGGVGGRRVINQRPGGQACGASTAEDSRPQNASSARRTRSPVTIRRNERPTRGEGPREQRPNLTSQIQRSDPATCSECARATRCRSLNNHVCPLGPLQPLGAGRVAHLPRGT
jgi:hypothetical protein